MMRVLPAPAGFISTSSPLRGPVIFSTTAPVYSSSTSMVTSSIGSSCWPSSLAEEDAGARDRQLEALAAHVLDQDAHLQLAAAGDLEGVAAGRVGDLDGDVRLGLLDQPLADDAGLDLAAVAPGEGRVVDAEGDRDRRRVDRLGGQGDVDRERGDRVRDGRLGHAREGDDVARLRLVDRLRRQAAEGQDLGDAELLDLLAHARQRLDGGAGAQRARSRPGRSGCGR